jgi:hypothetical protein
MVENADDFCPSRFERGRKTPPMSFIPFVFFFITNVLISFGMTLMLSELGQQRLQELKEKFNVKRS